MMTVFSRTFCRLAPTFHSASRREKDEGTYIIIGFFELIMDQSVFLHLTPCSEFMIVIIGIIVGRQQEITKDVGKC